MASMRRSTQNKRGGKGGTAFPKALNVKPTMGFKIRWVAPASGVASQTFSVSVLDVLASMATATATNAANTSFNPLFAAAKLKKIQVWDLNGNDLSVVWSGISSPDAVRADQGTVNRPSHLVMRPPAGSTASFWQTSVNASLVLFTVASNQVASNLSSLVVEVSFSADLEDAMIMQTAPGNTTVFTASSGSNTTAGYVYYRLLKSGAGGYLQIASVLAVATYKS